MTKTPLTPPQGGVLGVAALVCLAIAALGLAFDFALRARDGFWTAAQPGGAGIIGATAAVFAVLAGRLARIVLARRTQQREERDAGVHP